MSDLIDRQQAIDVLDKIFPADPMRNDFTQGIACGAALAKTYVEDLPSAQPEIIYCKDCKHYWIHKCMDSMPLERCDLEQTFYDPDRDFCSLAERREVTT